MIKNKAKEYPELTNQQLLSLIRANQLLIQDLDERLHRVAMRRRV